MEYRLGIVGSRNFNDFNLFAKGIVEIYKIYKCYPTLVVSGGAKGADTLGEIWADKNNIEKLIFKPEWNKYGKRAGIMRNTDIVENSDHILAFPSKYGRGTQDTIRKAELKNIPCTIIFID